MIKWPDGFENFADRDSFGELLEVWRQLRDEGGGKIAAKADLRPSLISQLLPKIIISELIDDDMRVRLTGTVVDAILKRNITGLKFSEIYTGETLSALMQQTNAMLAQPCGMLTRRQIRVPEGGLRSWQTLVLPLAGPDGEPKFLIGLHEVPEDDRRYVDDKAVVDTLTIGLANSAFLDLGFGVPANVPVAAPAPGHGDT